MVMHRRRGFTLIELLVVIAIIGILAAMLFPVFARARESARKTQCLANVKNIAIGIQMYLTDYDRFPPKEHAAATQSTSSGTSPARTATPSRTAIRQTIQSHGAMMGGRGRQPVPPVARHPG